MAEKKEKKTFIWQGLRIGFWTMIGLWIISTIAGIINPNLPYNVVWAIVGVIQIISVFFTFVVSIIHLTKYKEKALAITALVICSVLISYILLVLYGYLIGVSGATGA